MRFWLVIVLVLALSAAAGAQETQATDTSSGGQPSAPPTLAGQRAPRGLLTEGPGASYLTGGIAITQMFTDNAELTSGNALSDLSYDIQPHIALSRSTPRLSCDFGILAGFLVNRTLDQRNQASQSAALDLSYRVRQFVTLRLSDSFMNTSGLWSGVNAGATSTGIGAVQTPNSALATYGQFRANSALAELSGQLAADTFAGIRATQSYTWFPNGATSPVLGTLYGGQTYSAEAFYNHRFTARNWGGLTVRAQRFDLERSEGRTDSASLLFMYALNIRPNTSLSFFAGPELSVTSVSQGIAVPVAAFPHRMWSPATGAVFSWQGHTTSTSASFTRQVNSGGGLVSAVTLTSIEADLLRQLGRHLEFGPAFVYGQSVPIITSQSFRTYSGRLQFRYHVGRHYAFSGGYARDQQTALGTIATASANRVWISFSFDFLRPLGI